MSRFSGQKPSGQPPSIRDIAERQSAPASFPEDVPFDPAAGVTNADKSFGQRYEDPATKALPSPSSGVRAKTAADKMPFRTKG